VDSVQFFQIRLENGEIILEKLIHFSLHCFQHSIHQAYIPGQVEGRFDAYKPMRVPVPFSDLNAVWRIWPLTEHQRN
jgi:hypothetical protein